MDEMDVNQTGASPAHSTSSHTSQSQSQTNTSIPNISQATKRSFLEAYRGFSQDTPNPKRPNLGSTSNAGIVSPETDTIRVEVSKVNFKRLLND